MGSIKFGGFAAVNYVLSMILQASFYVLFPSHKNLTTGPYGLIFALLVHYHFDIPPTYRFRICGINANDKLFTYILGLQLLFSNSPYSFVSGLFGIISGLTYRSDILKFNKFKFPNFVNNFCARFFLPMLQSSQRAPSRPQALPTGRNPMPNTFVQPHPQGQAQGHAPTQGYADTLIPSGPFGGLNHNFVAPFPLQAQAPRAPPSEEHIQILTSMGFSREEVIRALERCNNDVQLATNLLLDH